MSEPLILISIRKQEIEAEIARLLARVASLRNELPELESAERVWRRLSGQSGTDVGSADESAEAERAEAMAGSKPPNTPTIPDMILTALRAGIERGRPGLEPKQMTNYIARHWWPNVPSVAISPIAWRMWKRGDLEKDGSLYKLPKNTEAADPSPEEQSAAPAIPQLALRPVEPAPGGGT